VAVLTDVPVVLSTDLVVNLFQAAKNKPETNRKNVYGLLNNGNTKSYTKSSIIHLKFHYQKLLSSI